MGGDVAAAPDGGRPGSGGPDTVVLLEDGVWYDGQVRHRSAAAGTGSGSGKDSAPRSEEDVVVDVLGSSPEKDDRTDWKGRIATVVRISVLVLIALAAATFLVLFFTTDTVKDATLDAMHWLEGTYEEHPVLSAGLCAVLYAISLLFFMPGTPFNLACGFIYGPWVGTAVAMSGSFTGAFAAYLLGKSIFRRWITDVVHQKWPKFRVVDMAVRRKGLLIVTLTRLSPVFPFPVLNYAFGVTQVRVWQYAVGTFVGLFPFTFAYTYLGSLMRDLAEMWADPKGDNDDLNIIWIVVGAVATILSIVVISYVTKRAIDQATVDFEEGVVEVVSSGDDRQIADDDKKDSPAVRASDRTPLLA